MEKERDMKRDEEIYLRQCEKKKKFRLELTQRSVGFILYTYFLTYKMYMYCVTPQYVCILDSFIYYYRNENCTEKKKFLK